MILPPQFKCDSKGCEAVRSESNHWWASRSNQGRIEIYPWQLADDDGLLNVTKHFCGAAHALQYVSSLMGKQETGK